MDEHALTLPEEAPPPEGGPADGCLPCDIAAGRVSVPGGVIHRTGHWIVEHSIGPLRLGTLIVKPARHVIHVADLTETEAAELGPLLRDTARITSELTRPDQVYVSLWSHAGGVPGHIHFVVQPVTPADVAAFGFGPKLQVAMFEADEPPAPDAVAAFARTASTRFRG